MNHFLFSSTENYLLSFISISSEIGGYVGLLLGVSMLHLVRFVHEKLEEHKQKSKQVLPKPPILVAEANDENSRPPITIEMESSSMNQH